MVAPQRPSGSVPFGPLPCFQRRCLRCLLASLLTGNSGTCPGRAR